MKTKNLKFLASLILAAVLAGTAQSQTTIISDNYTATTVGAGFNLGEGVNTGINPPTTRMTGTASDNLRYFQTVATRLPSFYDINSNRLRVSQNATIGRFTISGNGTTPFDFGPAVGAAYASPTNAAVYDVKISMRNNATSTARFSFAIGTIEGDANSWDFGVQLYRAGGTDDFYTIQKRINSASSSGGANINVPMGTTLPGTWASSTNINFLIRVTDAGAETNAFSSRVQVSIDNGATWIYDSSTDVGFRFDGPGRYIIFDQASNNSGTVFYDSFSIVSTYAPLPPAGRIWTGAGANDNWSTPENWGGITPVNGDPLIFNGITRQANVNDLTGLDVPSVAFNNGGFSLSGNPFSVSSSISNLAGANTFAGDFSLSAAALKTWSIASGSELILSNTTTIEVIGDNGLMGGGVLHNKGTMNIGVATTANPAFVIYEGKHIVDGGTFSSRGGYRIGSQASGSGAQTILTNNANFNLTAAGANFRVGDSAHPAGAQLLVNNSTVTMTGGSFGIPYAAGATGTVTQVGGKISGGIVAFNDNGAGTGVYTIQNGELEPMQIREDTASGVSQIYFDNAILRSTGIAISSNFFSGLDLAEIQAGGLILDAQSDVTIAQVLSGTGILVKSNFAIVTLTGANTYSGNTIVQAGKLFLPTIQTNTTAVQVAGGAEFGVTARAAGSTLSVSGLTFQGASSALNFDLGTFSNPTAPLARVSSLAVNGSVTINVANGSLPTVGQIVLLDYTGAIAGGFQFTLGSLPPGMTATLVNNTANSSIDLNITGVPGYRWTGAVNGDWDYSTQNWVDQQTQFPATYADSFPIEFLDGATTGSINVVISPSPSTITVSNNTLPYVMSGGFVTAPLFRKFGPGSFTRSGGEADSIANLELNAGAFVVTNFFDAILNTVISDAGVGTGVFVKQGASMLTIYSNNVAYDGAFFVQEGTLKMTGDASLGTTNGATIITNSATLDLNNFVFPHERVTVSGAGVNGQGAIIDSTTATGVANNLTDVTMTGDTTFGSPNGGRWDLRVRSGTGPGPGLKGNGFNLTKVGSGSVSIASQRNIGALTPYWEMNLGDVFINEGSLTFAEALTPGNPLKSIFVADGASFGTFDLNATNPILRTIYMTNATITAGGATGDTNMFNGPIQVTGTAHLRPNDTKLIVNGAIGGSGAVNISASGVGTVLLNGINTYPGDTTVTNGILGGIGRIAGNLVMLDGTNAPGGLGFVGTFTVNGDSTLAGTTLMELNRSQSPNSDRFVAGGGLSFGGTLRVVLATGAASPQAGDVYQLFNKGGSASFASIVLPDLSALPGGLAWDSSQLSVNGKISVTGTPTSPTISSTSLSGGNFVFSGTGGAEGSQYTILSSTNIATPVASWTPVSTNVFGTGGSFSYTNSINPATPQTFYLLRLP